MKTGAASEHAAAATLFIAGILARNKGPVLWCVRCRDLFAPALAAARRRAHRATRRDAERASHPPLRSGRAPPGPPEPIDVMALVPDYPPAAFVWRRVRRRVVRADGPERVFGEWWRADDERSVMRDYYRLEAADGSRYWVFRDGPAVEGMRWFLHGLFG